MGKLSISVSKKRRFKDGDRLVTISSEIDDSTTESEIKDKLNRLLRIMSGA